MNESALTIERPDLWHRALTLATSLTGYTYAPKLPLPDGTIYACGGPAAPAVNPFREEKDIEKRLKKLRKRLEQEKRDRSTPHSPWQWERWIEEAEKERDKGAKTAPTVFVPPGNLEWILHEVGHYVAATPEERLLPNYGVSASEVGADGDREWQAWAFEEIILAPFGPAREFSAPTCRDGAAFNKAGPMPQAYLWYIERQIKAMRVDVAQWRALYDDWIRYERVRRGGPSWERSA
jgi:hypothetical protein